MTYLPFWAGGLALASVVFLHYALSKQHLGVSGRISTLVNRARATLSKPTEAELSEAEMLEAVRAMTAAEFGECAVEAPVADARLATATPTSTASHVLFFVGLVLGGFVVSRASGTFAPTTTLSGDLFARFFPSSPLSFLVLFVGGLLVGVGTRMSGGCTSGHGLIGVPRLERGSLLATAAFFGTGIVASLVIEALR